ncbi:MAG: isochorismate synthase, partial [Halobacteriales archaeon]|nr:isochorismate synthase [Halobacteriales archaeon]
MPAHRDGLNAIRTDVESGTLVSRSLPVPERSIRAVLAGRSYPRVAWAPPGASVVAGIDAAVALTAAGANRFDDIRQAARTVFADRDEPRTVPHAARPRLFGGFSFHVDHDGMPPWEGFPAAAFVLPRIQYTRTERGCFLTANAYGTDIDPDDVIDACEAAAGSLERTREPPPAEPPGVTAASRVPSRETWRRQVETSLRHIADGSLRKVVL